MHSDPDTVGAVERVCSARVNGASSASGRVRVSVNSLWLPARSVPRAVNGFAPRARATSPKAKMPAPSAVLSAPACASVTEAPGSVSPVSVTVA